MTTTGIDGVASLQLRLKTRASGSEAPVYHHLHRVLAQDNFVLTVSEGSHSGHHTTFWELYRIIEAIAPPEEWKHHKGKF